MGGSSSISSMPMASGKLSSSAQSSTPPIGYNPGTITNWNPANQQQAPMAYPGGGPVGNQGAQQSPNWGNFLRGQGPLLEEGQTYQMSPDQIRRQQMRDQINQQALTQPVMQTFTPPQRQATGKGPSTPQNDPYFQNAPVQGPTNMADMRSFQRVPAPRAPGYDWARIIASSLFPNTGGYGGYGGYNGGGGGYTGYGNGYGPGYGGVLPYADGGKVDEPSEEDILELARKILNERG